jgi:hypothetical protein
LVGRIKGESSFGVTEETLADRIDEGQKGGRRSVARRRNDGRKGRQGLERE